jgi:hypothetical protein
MDRPTLASDKFGNVKQVFSFTAIAV